MSPERGPEEAPVADATVRLDLVQNKLETVPQVEGHIALGESFKEAGTTTFVGSGEAVCQEQAAQSSTLPARIYGEQA